MLRIFFSLQTHQASDPSDNFNFASFELTSHQGSFMKGGYPCPVLSALHSRATGTSPAPILSESF